MNRTATEIRGTATVAAPDPVPCDRVFDLSMAGRCIPAGRAGQPTAGAFFDVQVLGEHRSLIAIGDVAGHGYGVGSRARRLRSEVRHHAPQATSPAELLSLLDATYGFGDDDDIATVWIGIYDSDSHVLRYASAGHPPPVIAEVGGPARLLAAASAPPLGTGAVAAHVRADVVLWRAGALLVAYSDGLVERPERDLEDQIHEFRDLVGWTHVILAADAGPRIVAETLLNDAVPGPASTLDDACILVLRRDAL
jgi:serine phosphatase RsbU (regulator of sigma subunit)